jgi:hypothetical protein
MVKDVLRKRIFTYSACIVPQVQLRIWAGPRICPSNSWGDAWSGHHEIGNHKITQTYLLISIIPFVKSMSHSPLRTATRENKRKREGFCICGGLQTCKRCLSTSWHYSPLPFLNPVPIYMGGAGRSLRWVSHICEVRATMTVLCEGSENGFITCLLKYYSQSTMCLQLDKQTKILWCIHNEILLKNNGILLFW